MVKIGFLNLLTIIFIMLKLVEVIDWHWFFVLLPTIFNVSVIIIFIVIFITLGVFNGFNVETNRKYKSFLR